MTVEDIRNWVNFELNKHQTGNTLSKDEYNLCLKWANEEYFKLKYSLPEQYRPGQPLSGQAWAVTQENIDALSPFLMAKGGKNYPQMIIDTNGFANYPSDYVHVSSIRYGKRVVEVVSNDVLGDRLDSPIVQPTSQYPICCFYSGYIQFYPTDLKFVNFDYLRMPTTPIWGATIINDEYVYNPNTSTQLEWPEFTHIDIANMIVNYAAKNLRDFDMVQVSENRKDKGQ
jgi:hypothetical protein